MALRELRYPRRGAGDVRAQAFVDDDDLAATATLVHHRRDHVFGRHSGGHQRRRLLQTGHARVRRQQKRRQQQSAVEQLPHRPAAADMHCVCCMVTTSCRCATTQLVFGYRYKCNKYYYIVINAKRLEIITKRHVGT